MLITIADRPVLAMRLTLPAMGRWTCSAELDGDEAPEGQVEIVQGDVRLSGTVYRAGVVAGTLRAIVVGGSGGIGRGIPARSYQGVTARAVVEDLLAAAGERLDSMSTRDALTAALPYWTRTGGPAGSALSTLVQHLGLSWRMLPAGSVWVGRESWPSAPETFAATELDRDHTSQTVLLAPEGIGLFPGVTYRGDRVDRVEYVVTRDGPLRATYWIDS